jgi:endo-1,4-beta-xylanase
MMGTVSNVIRRTSASPSSLAKLLFLFLLCITTLIFSLAASAQVVVSSDFEDGVDGWIGFAGAPQPTVSGAEFNTGTHSLLTTGRTQTYQGPGLVLTNTLVGGQTYVFKVAVRLADATPGSDTVNMTMLNTVNGNTGYANVSGGTVTNTAWTILQGTYTVPTSGVTNLTLYIEDDSNATAQYYIDTFSVTGGPASDGCSTPPDNSGFASNFDDNSVDGWVGRGAANVSLTTDAHSGPYSLLVQGRTATWNGATHDITGKMCNGQQYWVEAWVKMAPGQPATSLNLSLQYTDAANQQHYPGVATSPSPVTDSQWVRLKSKPYTFSGSYTNLQIYVQSAGSDPTFASFEIDDIKVVYMPPPTIENIPPISQAFAGDFPVGFAAVDADILGAHGQLAALHYNSVTPGNDLKWDTTEPSEGNFNFGPADAIVSWAQAHNIKVRGHNFVWHNQVPNWVWIDPVTGKDMSTEPYSDANKAVLLGRMKNHIDALINHYYGPSSTFGNTIYVWDVVNEAISDSNPADFRHSKWYQITVDPSAPAGPPEYMDDAFIYARQALDGLGISRDQVELCYNDYNTTIAAKRDFIYNWVKGAIARGVPIDCVGHQFHNTINFPIDDQGSAASKQSVIDTINLFSTLAATSGKPIVNEITEFDISLYRYGNCNQTFYTDYDDLLAGDQADLINEGYRYRDYFQIFKNMKDKIDSVTIWGLGDDDSWLNPSSGKAGCNVTANDGPLPFDSYLQHKYAYTGIVNPLALPGANLAVTITPNASTIVSGSALSYVITASNNGPNDAANLTLTTSVPSSTAFQSIVAPNGWNCTTPAVGANGAVTCSGSALTNGSSAQFTLNTLVVCATPDGTAIPNAATVTSSTLNPNPNPQNSASVTVQVSNPPPVISGLSVTPSVLWPPNHKMVNATLSYSITDNCDANIVPTIRISSNEGTASDWQVVDANHVQLRAERAGSGGDRVYTITLTATDSAGGASTGSVTVTVPHDQGK